MRTRRASRSTHTDGKACVPLSRRISKIVLRQSTGPLTYFLSTIHMVAATTYADTWRPRAILARSSGMVNDVKARCAAEIEQYDRCLKANVNHPDTCMPQLHRLWQCSEEKEKAACSCEPPCSSKPSV
jgi:hypothetical protein